MSESGNPSDGEKEQINESTVLKETLCVYRTKVVCCVGLSSKSMTVKNNFNTEKTLKHPQLKAMDAKIYRLA